MNSDKISDKQKTWIIKICAISLPIEVFFTQLDIAKEFIGLGYDNTWVYILPNS